MKKYICEGVGTMMLTLIACGVAVMYGNVLATSLAFGLVIVAAAYSIGNVSGCHINPAVSIALTVSGKMEVKECVKYIISQVIGAFVGSLLLWACLSQREVLGANAFGGTANSFSVWTALLVEVILTFIFTTVILGVTDKKENGHVTGIVIGLTLMLVHLFGIPFTGTSVNPARSLAPAVIQGGDALKQVWVFIVAPITGAIISGLFYKFVLQTGKKSK
jgi:aquaporin Z